MAALAQCLMQHRIDVEQHLFHERPGDVARHFKRDRLEIRGVILKTIQIIPSDGGGSQLPVPCYSSPLLNVLLFTRHCRYGPTPSALRAPRTCRHRFGLSGCTKRRQPTGGKAGEQSLHFFKEALTRIWYSFSFPRRRATAGGSSRTNPKRKTPLHLPKNPVSCLHASH